MRKVLLVTVLLSCLSLRAISLLEVRYLQSVIKKRESATTKKEYFSTIEYPIREQNRKRMSYSYKSEGPVSWKELAIICVLCRGFNDEIYTGEMVVHKDVAEELCEIFCDIFESGFKIEKMHIMDRYKADDNEAMLDNNSSALCVRKTTDGTKWSNHSYGKAVDINPARNPYVSTKNGKPIKSTVLPPTAAEYLDRKLVQGRDGVITPEVIEVFKKRGWDYGGDWTESRTDYHHFEKHA